MECHDSGAMLREISSFNKKYLLVGQPNVGKSVIFSLLTGKYVNVSNYPGTTVEIMSGKSAESDYLVVDTPGLGSIVPRSEDEMVSIRMLMSEGISGLVQVGDAKNMRRTLLLTLTLSEAGVPMVLDLNMADEAERRGYRIQVEELSRHLGIPVVMTVATEKKGKEELIKAMNSPGVPSITIGYDKKIEDAIVEIENILPESPVSKRFIALTLLSANLSMVDEIISHVDSEKRQQIKKIILKTQAAYSEPLSQVIMQSRTALVEKLVRDHVIRREGVSITKRFIYSVEDISTHPILGLFVLAFVLYLLYEFVGVFAAGTVVDFFEGTVFEKYLIPPLVKIFSVIPIKLVRDFFIGKYGQITMGLTYAISIVFPIVTAFFIAFSILEDSGYLPRLAVMLNRGFSKMGLSGKAVVPMVLGLGCGTMATLVTRVLETRRERIITTLLLALGIPCSAQLGVILGMFAVLGNKALIFFFTLIAVQLLIVGYLASKIIPGTSAVFVTEVPPYRVPRISNVLTKTYYRAKWFLKEAVPLFLIGTAFLFFADLTGLLNAIIKFASPVVVGWLNLPPKATEAFIVGFLRRDYGAAGLFVMFEKGMMDTLQAFVSLITITLFIPCLANLLVIIKERGAKIAAAIFSFVFSYAFFAGGIINIALRTLGVRF